MANTPILYNAAYSGAMSGVSSRWLTSAAASTFTTIINACVNFADLVDVRLGIVSEASEADANLLRQICGSFWWGRIPTVSITTADVAPLCDLFLAGRSALDPAAGSGSEPYAMVLSMFGETAYKVMLAGQITSSNNQAPAYTWVPPFAVNRFAVGPDGNMYANASTGGNAIRRYLTRSSSGPIARHSVASTGTASGMPAFFGQSPQSGIDTWAAWVASSSGGRRVTGIRGMPVPQFAGNDIFTFGAPSLASDLAFDSAGNLWIVAGAAVGRVNPTGLPGALLFDVYFTGGNWPGIMAGVAIDSNGNMWASNYVPNAGTLRMVTAANVAASVGLGPLNIVPDVIITSPELRGVQNIVFDYNGNLWVSCFENPSLVQIAAADLAVSGSKTAAIVLSGGGQFGNGTTRGPAHLRFMPGFGPLR